MPTPPTLRAIQSSDLEALLTTAEAADLALWGQAETDLDELSHELRPECQPQTLRSSE